MNRRLYIAKHNLIKIVHTYLHEQYINQHDNSSTLPYSLVSTTLNMTNILPLKKTYFVTEMARELQVASTCWQPAIAVHQLFFFFFFWVHGVPGRHNALWGTPRKKYSFHSSIKVRIIFLTENVEWCYFTAPVWRREYTCTASSNAKIEKISSMNFNILQTEKRQPLFSVVEQ